MLEHFEAERKRVVTLLNQFYAGRATVQNVADELEAPEHAASLEVILNAPYAPRKNGDPTQVHLIMSDVWARWVTEGHDLEYDRNIGYFHDHFEEHYRTDRFPRGLDEYANAFASAPRGVKDSVVVTGGIVQETDDRVLDTLNKATQIRMLGKPRHMVVALAERMDNCTDMGYASESERGEILLKDFLGPLAMEVVQYDALPEEVLNKASAVVDELMHRHCIDPSRMSRYMNQFQIALIREDANLRWRVSAYGSMINEYFPGLIDPSPIQPPPMISF